MNENNISYKLLFAGDWSTNYIYIYINYWLRTILTMGEFDSGGG